MPIKWNRSNPVKIVHRILKLNNKREFRAKPALCGIPRHQIHKDDDGKLTWEGPNFTALTPKERAEATLQLLSTPGGEELLHQLENPA
jgi:hypothetical protein